MSSQEQVTKKDFDSLANAIQKKLDAFISKSIKPEKKGSKENIFDTKSLIAAFGLINLKSDIQDIKKDLIEIKKELVVINKATKKT